MPFKKALLFARSLNLKTHVDNTPGGKGAVNVGTGIVRVAKGPQFIPFEQSLLFARSLNFKGCRAWDA